jgi:low temperature requirement protein LtrA
MLNLKRVMSKLQLVKWADEERSKRLTFSELFFSLIFKFKFLNKSN